VLCLAVKNSSQDRVALMPLERGGVPHHHLVGKYNFDRGLLEAATDFRIETEIKPVGAQMQLPEGFRKERRRCFPEVRKKEPKFACEARAGF
jgi:hypothetical protein